MGSNAVCRVAAVAVAALIALLAVAAATHPSPTAWHLLIGVAAVITAVVWAAAWLDGRTAAKLQHHQQQVVSAVETLTRYQTEQAEALDQRHAERVEQVRRDAEGYFAWVDKTVRRLAEALPHKGLRRVS